MKYGNKTAKKTAKKPVRRKTVAKKKAPFKPCAGCKSKPLCKAKGKCLKKK